MKPSSLRLGIILTALVLTGCAAGPGTGHDPGGAQGPPGPVTAETAASILASLPVYPGATPSATSVPMAMGTPSSSYLEVASATYAARASGRAIEAWYEAKLGQAGWRPSGDSTSTDHGKVTVYGESLAKGSASLMSVNLSFLPSARGSTTFMVTVNDIALPPRPAASRVPASAVKVVIRGRASAPSPWRTKVVSGAASVERWVTLVNSVNLFPAGTAPFNCAADFGQGATLTFENREGSSWTFRVTPACALMKAPDGSILSAGSIWQRVQDLLGLGPEQGG